MTYRARIRFAAATVAASAVVATMGITPAAAGPVEDQRQRVAQITDQLEALEEQAAVIAEQADVAAGEYEQAQGDVDEAEADVAAQQAAVEVLQSELSEVAVQAFMSAGAGGLGALFSSTDSLTDDLQREELSRVALNSGTASSDDLERELNELAEQQEQLEEHREEAKDTLAELEEAEAETASLTEGYRQARAEAEQELGDLIREEEERRARESYERMQREAAEAAAQQQAQIEQTQQAQQESQSARPAVPPPAAPQPTTPRPASPGQPTPAAPAPAPPPAVNIPPASSRAGTAVNAAMTQLGVPWVFGKAEPGVAFDCSGLTSWAWGTAGVYMPHQSGQQYGSLPHVPAAAAQPGDLIFFYSPISHVGMYIGNGQMVHAPNSGSTVHVRSVNWDRVVGVARPG